MKNIFININKFFKILSVCGFVFYFTNSFTCFTDFTDENKNERVSIFTAIEQGDGETVLELIKETYLDEKTKKRKFLLDINKKNKNQEAPLYYACFYKKPEIVEILLRRPDIDVNTTDEYGFTPLHIACQKKSFKIVKTLVNHKNIKLNMLTNKKETPLHIACESIDPEIAQELLKTNKVDIYLKDIYDRTPVYIAKSKEYKDQIITKSTFDALKDHNPKLNGTLIDKAFTKFKEVNLTSNKIIKLCDIKVKFKK